MGTEDVNQPTVSRVVSMGWSAGLSRDLAGTTLANIGTAALGIASGILVARLLGPEGRGELAAIQNWPALLAGFGSLGVPIATAYYCGKFPNQASRTYATAWLLLMVFSLPSMAIGYWLMPWLLQAQTVAVVRTARVLLLLVLVHFATALPFWAFQGLSKFSRWNLVRIQMPVLWLLVVLVSTWLSLRAATSIAYGYLLAMALHGLTWSVVMFRTVPGPYTPNHARLWDLLRYGVPTVLAGIPQQLNLRLDQLMMAALFPAQLLGYYVVAVTWSNIFAPLFNSVSQVIFPRLAAAQSREVQSAVLQKALRMSVLGAIGVGVVWAGLTPMLLPAIFGHAFSAAVPTALVLIAAASVASVGQVASDGLRGLGVPTRPMIAELTGLPVTVGLLALLLPRYRVMGAAVTSLASYSVTLAVLVLLLGQELGKSPWELVIPGRRDLMTLWSGIHAFAGHHHVDPPGTSGQPFRKPFRR